MARILVVDDNAINREFLSALFGYAGHEVHEAGDGRQALTVAHRVEPTLVITDILMPTMDGVELARRLGADPELNGVPVIFYTATYRVGEARSLAADCGVSTVIAKPAEPQELLDAVHEELGVAAQIVADRHIEALTGRKPKTAATRLFSTSVDEIAELQWVLRGEIEQPDTPRASAGRLRELSTRLDVTLNRSQTLSLRLAEVAELGPELATYKDPTNMLEMFCHAARDVLSSRLAAVCTLNENGSVLDYAVWGLPAEQIRALRDALEPTSGMFGEIMRHDNARRYNGIGRLDEGLGLPACHPHVDNLLLVPIRSATRTHGWFYVADRLGHEEYSAEDVQLAEVLASQLAPEYENLLLIDRINRHAGLLEVEVDERKRALEALAESNTRFKQLAESVHEVFFLVDARLGDVLYVSPAYASVWGRSAESLYAEPFSWLDAVHADDYRAALRGLARGRRTGDVTLKLRIQRPDGTRWVRVLSAPVRDESGAVSRVAGTAEDITANEVAERKLARLSRIHALLSGINSAIVRIRERGALLDEVCRVAVEHGGFATAWIGLRRPGAEELEFITYRGRNGLAAEELAGAFADESARETGLVEQTLRADTHLVFNDLGTHTYGHPVLALALASGCRSVVSLQLTPDERPAGAIVLFAEESDMFDADEMRLLDELAGDVSFALEYMSREERLHHLAYYDALTDLPNTTLLHEQLAKSIARRPDAKTALFLIDIDNFTRINDAYGRHVGDRLLLSFAERLSSVIGSHGDVARIGSDTFAVTAGALLDEGEAGSILQERITGALNRPFGVDGTELRVSARTGASVYPADGEDPHTLFKNAETALKQAKTSGARYVFYSPQLNERIGEELALEQELLAAVEKQQFELHYQPKLDAKTGALIGLEALLRWNSPAHGLVAPARFVPALETSELILDVGRWVLEQALTDYDEWRASGRAPPPVSINVSPLQLRYPDFADMVFATLRRHGADAGRLELEITENVIMADIEASIERLGQLSERGVMISIDDFGTGYSSLRYLAKLPVQALKVDRSFVAAMTGDSDSMTLVSTIIGLAHALNLLVVAEGVETEEQAKLLRLMKCDQLQGFLFARPQPASAVAGLLAARPPNT